MRKGCNDKLYVDYFVLYLLACNMRLLSCIKQFGLYLKSNIARGQEVL